jgi:hypothetical protein
MKNGFEHDWSKKLVFFLREHDVDQKYQCTLDIHNSVYINAKIKNLSVNIQIFFYDEKPYMQASATVHKNKKRVFNMADSVSNTITELDLFIKDNE